MILVLEMFAAYDDQTIGQKSLVKTAPCPGPDQNHLYLQLFLGFFGKLFLASRVHQYDLTTMTAVEDLVFITSEKEDKISFSMR